MTSPWAVLSLGILLGVRHAFDPDHLVAVTTIVSEYKNPLRAVWIGVSWGLGHTTTLFVVGLLVLFLGLRIPDNLALSFEFLVGAMLILLGVQTFWAFRLRRVHIHPHHEPEQHQHFHSHETSHDHVHHTRHWNNLGQFLIAGIVPGEHHTESARSAIKPFFRLKSYLVGTVHGMAGSAALMLLVLASLKSLWSGVTYILVFGLGTAVSMGIISIFISLPFSVSGRLPRINRIVQAAAGSFSIIFGLILMYQVGIVEGLLVGR
ncbi:MAG: urease accessory protein UreH [Chloroflexi bacterium]|nr:urease accessory protein UreH [Chloroflexota bacterium]